VNELFWQNQQWRQTEMKKDPQIFKRLASKQNPRYLWIGCADSRVPPETICGLPPGSLFVTRNIANVVNNIDVSLVSVVQYAVMVLKVEHIVICGHYNCGGVAAALELTDHSAPLENWLRSIRDVYRLHSVELDRIKDKNSKWRRLVELNVVEQAVNIYKTRFVQARRVETYQRRSEFAFIQPRIHPVVYDPATGELKPLDVEMHDVLQKLRPIYNLYKATDDDDELLFEGMGASSMVPFEDDDFDDLDDDIGDNIGNVTVRSL